jgi:hypothetical protein
METCATEHLGDLHLTHAGTQYLETLHGVPHKLGEAIHGLTKLQERIGTFFVDTLRPGTDRRSGHEEGLRGLCCGPALRSTQLKNRHPFDGWILGPPMRGDPLHAGILDADLLLQQGDYCGEALQFTFLPEAQVDTIRCPAASVCRCVLSQRNHMQQG